MKKVLGGIGIAIVLFLYYYFALPVVNIHSQTMWIRMIMLFVIIVAVQDIRIFVKKKKNEKVNATIWIKVMFGVSMAAVAVFVICNLVSSPFFKASKYQKLMQVKNGDFKKEIEEISYDEIPMLDKESAEILGNRKMGSMVDMVSQYEVDSQYTQINYKGRPVRVTPLKYASVIKWFTNRESGIPAYMTIDMTSQNVECVKLKEGMKYSPFEHFNRNLDRHLRFNYPTYIFDDESFEIDEDGVPYWVCPVREYTIGLFGGATIGRVVLCNAVTGECTDYAIEDVPQWVDRVYSADLLIEQFTYYGNLKHGFWNSVLSQKDCLQTTNGYNYIALDDDVWVYTGVTSVSGDQSNVGFVLINQRTRETRFYAVEGAIEDSAMSSAEGQVQNLGYTSTFPLLLNISDQPTYFVALKDDAGLVKKYGMVNVQKYQIVAIGDTVAECEENYTKLMYKNKLIKEEEVQTVEEKLTAKVQRMAQTVIDGTTHYYLTLEGDSRIFDVEMSPSEDVLGVLYINEGDMVTVVYDTENGKKKTIVSVIKLYRQGEEPEAETNTGEEQVVTGDGVLTL